MLNLEISNFIFDMKTFVLCLAVGTLLSLQPVQAQRQFALDDAYMGDQIKAPTETLPLDQAFAALSRAASINTFADVTAIPADTMVKPYAERPTNIYEMNIGGRSNVIGATAFQAGMTRDRTGKETFVFWRRPDPNRVVDLIVAHQKRLDAEYLAPDYATAIAAIQQFYADKYGWIAAPKTVAEHKQRVQGVPQSLKVSELPPEIRQSFRAELVRQLLMPGGLSSSYDAFELRTFQSARLRLVEEKVNRYTADGSVPGRANARIVKIFFPDRRSPAYIGAPLWANPNLSEPLAGFELPAYLNEETPRFTAEPISVEAPPAVAAVVTVAAEDFAAEDVFKKKVKLASPRMPLRALVAELARQSGVELAVAADVAPDAQVLANSNGMKLSAALNAVARLYGARWVKAAPGYELQSRNMDELHRAINQLGLETLYAKVWYHSAETDSIAAYIAEEVSVALDRDQLESSEGAPFSQLPSAVQSHILQMLRDDKAGNLVVRQQRLDEAMEHLDDFLVRFTPFSDDTPRFFGAFHTEPNSIGTLEYGGAGFMALTPDGQFITQLFPLFTVDPISKDQEEFYALQEAGEKWQAAYNAQERGGK